MNKIYKTAPLPFQGQKRNFIEQYKYALKEIKSKKNITTIVDLFGGSGLLSHTAKGLFPEAQVIYNDFDNYNVRLRNVNRTNHLLSDIRNIIGIGKTKGYKLDNETKKSIIDRILIEENTGFIDYITISSSLLFSAKYVTGIEELRTETFYNNTKQSNYDVNADEYLSGLDIVRQDYCLLYERYKNIPGVLFVIDPPYLSTDTKTYSSDKYWKLKDYLNVLNVLSNTDYIYFTSNKSSLIELCEWFSQNYNLKNPFFNAHIFKHDVQLNRTAKYTDIMLYKYR